MSRSIEFPDIFPEISSERIDLKEFTPNDVDAFFALRSDEEFMKYIDLHPMKNKSEARDRVSSSIQAFRTGEGINWKITQKNDDTLIGYIGIWRLDYKNIRGEIGFGLDLDFQQQGFMSEAMPLVLGFGFKEMGLHTIKADVNPKNTASIQLLLKNNFKHEAHLRENYYFNGEFLDSDYYGLLESEYK